MGFPWLNMLLLLLLSSLLLFRSGSEDERRNGSLFLSCSVVLIATVRDGKCFRSKSFVKCVIEKIMHPGTTGG